MLKIIHMKVNDKPVEVAVEPGELLADTLRNRFGLTSVKKGCSVGEAAVQCGFCTPGIIMSAVEIAASGRKYSREELRRLISGHLCRCTGYENILNALERAQQEYGTGE